MATPYDPNVIRLDDLLKLSGIADSGGHAKAMVQGGGVRVNGEVDTRRGRKLRMGDRVQVGDRTISVDEALLRQRSGTDKPD
jgi:ribosome-associated protein